MGTSASFSPSRTLVRTCATVGKFARYAALQVTRFCCADYSYDMQVRAPDEGPSRGSPSASRISRRTVIEQQAIEERYDPKLLRFVARKHNISSTKSLVAAYNVTTDENERAVLLGWLCKYHKRKADCLEPNAVLEYAELANIAPRSISEKDILKDLIRDLTSCICEGNFLTPNNAVALYRALVNIVPSAYGGTAQLMATARKLMGSLTEELKLTREIFADHETAFLALHQTFFLLRCANQAPIDEEEKQELRRTIAAKERTMKLSCKHYPVNFHFKALRQAVERLKDEDATSQIAQTKRYLLCGLCGFMDVLHFLRNLTRCDIDPADVLDAYERNQAAIDNMGVTERPWFDSFRRLMAKRLETSKDKTKLRFFMSEFDTAIHSQYEMTKGEDLQSLRFGIIQETRLLASQTTCETVRKEVTKKLLMLSTRRTIFEEWFEDADIFTAFLDALHEIHTMSDHNQETAEAFRNMQQFCDRHAKRTLRAWLGGKAMEEKLQIGKKTRSI